MDRINSLASTTQTFQLETGSTGSPPSSSSSVTTHIESASTSTEQTHLPKRDSATPQTTPLDQYSIGSGASTLPYLTGLLLRAGATATSDHVDPATLGRARFKIQQLLRTMSGIMAGTLTPGSRTPIANIPEWITPVVSTGGFATRELAAGGPLTQYEKELAKQAGILVTDVDAITDEPESIRLSLNQIWFDEPHFSRLSNMLDSGKYRVNSPEEAVMLVLVALHRLGHSDKAEELVSTISPFMGKVRFFPEPAEYPLPLSRNLALVSVADALTQLDNRFGPNPEHKSNTRQRIEKNALVFDQWLPLSDRLLRLLQDTVEGELPYYNADGKLCGGMPLINVSCEWLDKAMQYQADREQVLAQHPELKHRTSRKRGSERILQRSLEVLLAYPPESRRSSDKEGFQKIQLTLRKTLADIHRKHGLPKTDKHQKSLNDRQFWLEQYEQSRRAGQPLLAQLLPLKHCDLSKEDNLTFDTTGMPESIRKLLDKIQPRPLSELLERGDITSAEMLASKLLEVAPIVRSESIQDPTLATLFAHLYQAFNKRRSLLLLNLKSQVRVEELPWVKLLQSVTPIDEGKRLENAQNFITGIIFQALTHFPHTILPNTFIKSLGQVFKTQPESSMEQLPLTEEIAADIFMQKFSEKYLKAAKRAASLMQGTLYEKYYGLDYGIIANLETPEAFYDLCLLKSGARCSYSYGCQTMETAESGKIIEWQQVITTHNLATLADAINLFEQLRGEYGRKLSHKVADWVVTECIHYNPGKPDLIRLHEHKSIAYAFRQMLFFLSFQPKDVQLSALEKLKTIPPKIDDMISAINLREIQTETPELTRVPGMACDDEMTAADDNDDDSMDAYENSSNRPTRTERPSQAKLLKRLNQKKKHVSAMINSFEIALSGQQSQQPPKPFVGWL